LATTSTEEAPSAAHIEFLPASPRASDFDDHERSASG
jgi:hypothetical protein